MTTFAYLILAFFVIIAIKISVQLELILIRVKHLHIDNDKANKIRHEDLTKVASLLLDYNETAHKILETLKSGEPESNDQ